jgi:serine/threonine protein kinase
MVWSSEKRIGPYRLLKLLMTGQNSQVWEVLNDVKQERFALKALLPEAAKDREQVASIKNEYAVGSTLDHKRVIHVYEYGKCDNSPYLVLELYPHPNIKFYIQQRPEALTPELLPKIIIQGAEGLAYLHSQGYVHRDVKPDNFLLSPEGRVKLIDFALAQKPKTGLARLFAGKQKIQGTRSYMSPEQIRGQPLDRRADLYSFGCMVYELVNGKPPYTGNDTNELLNKHLKSAIPSLLTAGKNVTNEFADLIKSTLAKDPAGRPASMDDFLAELRAINVFKPAPRTIAPKKKAEGA